MADRYYLAACLIRVFEGLRTTAYQDTGGIWTIGYGHTAGVQQGDTCTEEQAQEWLKADSAHLFSMVTNKDDLPAAALVSFGYNCGSGSLQKVLAGSSDIYSYVHDHKGNTLSGLVSRRLLEGALAGIEKPAT